MKAIQKIMVGVVLSVAPILVFGQDSASKLDSLLSTVSTMPDDTNKLNALYYIGFNSNNTDTVDKYAHMMLDLATQLDNKRMQAQAYTFIAWAEYCTHDFVAAYMYNTQALDIYRKLGNKTDIASIYMYIATTLSAMNDGAQAIDYYKLSLDMFYELEDSSMVCVILGYLGGISVDNYMFASAKEYFNKAIEISTSCNDTSRVASGNMMLGNLYLRQYKYENFDNYKYLDTACVFLRKSHEIIMHNGNSDFVYLMQLLPKLSNVYLQKALHPDCRAKSLMLDSCQYYFDEGFRLGREQGYGFSDFQLSFIKVKYLIARNRMPEAIKLIRETEQQILKSVDDVEEYSIDVNECYVDYYQKLGDYKKAFEHSQQLYNTYEQRNVHSTQVKITQAQMQTEFDWKLRQRDREEFERELVHKELEARQRMMMVFFLFAFLITVFFATIIHRNSQKRKKLNEELAANQERVLEQSKTISRANHDITSSILYARHIQEVAMPSVEVVRSIFPDSMVFFRPRDIVSGDFYWVAQVGRYKAVAVVDCTGHGVPGAFMSMLGLSILNDKFAALDPQSPNFTAAYMLDTVRDTLRASLRQNSDDYTNKDGMDMAFCIFDTETSVLQYAGAFRPLLFVRNGEITQYDADRIPISTYLPTDKPFTNNKLEIKQGDVIYMYSDGITDQFGGAQTQKFTARRLRDMIAGMSQKPFNEQFEIIENTIDTWSATPNEYGPHSQTDDMVLVGIRF